MIRGEREQGLEVPTASSNPERHSVMATDRLSSPDLISEAVERLLEFTLPIAKLEADEQREIEAPMNLGLNVVRRIYGAGTSDLARYCRRYDYIRRRDE